MSYRAPPNPTEERARLTQKLIAERGTDTDRWAQIANLATQWDARAAMAAELIPAGASVLDVGAGAMALGALLKPGSKYQPADVVERQPGCFVVDLNRGEFPPGQYDWVTFLGVLEYVHDLEWPLRQAALAAPSLIATYCCHLGGDLAIRHGMGWVNALDAAAFQAALEHSGWQVQASKEVKRGPTNIQLLFQCRRAT